MKKIFITSIICMFELYIFAQSIEKTYYFNNPTFEQYQGYEQIKFDDCMQYAEMGKPVLPWQSVSLLLPQNTDAQNIVFEFSDFVEVEGIHILYPYQEPRPLSDTTLIPFKKDEIIYASREIYPSTIENKVSTQYLNGYSFALSSFTPVRYIPVTGKVSYAQTVTVRIEVTASKTDKSNMVRLTPEIQGRIERLAQNPEAVKLYQTKPKTITDGYELLVITPEEWVSHFDEYKAFYENRALRTRVTSLEHIYSTMEGRDDQEKIRSYILQEYENEGIMMVLLGGDSPLVPFRGLYCYVSDEYIDPAIPADMYYVCLDGTWNDDNDEYWGEVGEDDLFPELAIARMPFNNELQFNNMMHKTLEYQSNPVLGELHNVILGGEYLGDGYYGSNDLELIIGEHNDDGYTTIGIPENYNFRRVYEEGETGWSGTIFKNNINEFGGQYVHHVGHANTDYVAGWYVNTTNDNSFAQLDGINHNYNFFHSHGCICGDFTHTCILERLVNISTGFVAATGNSRYGWYIPWGDGPARHLHREFVDSYYHDRLPYIGTAFVEMKIMTAPLISQSWGDYGALRWNLYDINILGDVAICPWLDEPFIPNVQYAPALIVGTTETSIIIDKDDVMQSNFRCSLFHNDDLLAFDITNNNGVATLQFDEPLNIIDTMQLIITGPNAWPQTYQIVGFNENVAYVYADGYEIIDNQGNDNGKLDFGEAINMNMSFYNAGTLATSNVTATLSTSSKEYIEITNGTVNIGEIGPNSSINIDNAFSFNVSENVPDQTYICFTITCTDGNNTWRQNVYLKVLAPIMELLEISYDDSLGNNNGFVDAGEDILIHFSGKNAGHSMAPNVIMEASCDNSFINFENNITEIGNISENEEFTGNITFHVEEDTPDGVMFSILMKLQSGYYEDQDNLRFTVGTVKENFESGDFSHLEWQFGYDLPWVVTDEVSYSGNYSAASGAINDDEISSLIIEIMTTSDGEISFYYKTSTEYKKDYFVFYIDGKLQNRWSGEIDWTSASFEISAGSHILEWRYDKSPRGQAGADCCWIDDIIFPGNCVIMDVNNITNKKNINIYPNPINNYIVVEGNDIQEIEVYNTLGVKLISKFVKGSLSTIFNLNTLSNGVYFICIVDNKGNITRKKIIKK